MHSNITYDNVISIIVIYKPNLINLKKIAYKHSLNFKSTLLINNSPSYDLSNLNFESIKIINNKKNLGLAKALNIGILCAKKSNFKYVALFDQDTLLPSNFSKKMILFINNYNSNNHKDNILLFCPNFYNLLTDRYNTIKIVKLLRIKSYYHDSNKISFPTYSITSGSITPIINFNKIGLFDENLFIDLIDTEWCLRAQYYGYKIVQNNRLVIKHNLGQSYIKLFSRKIQIHSPLRLYYFFRNSFYLYYLPHISINWIISDIIRNLFRFIFYMLFVKKRGIYFKYIIKGYYHGLIRKMDKFEA